MTMIIRAQGFKLTEALRKHLRQRFEQALADFDRGLSRIDIYLKDLNGPDKGGVDKAVQVDARLPGMNPIAVEATADDLYAAISSAARRTERAVRKAQDRKHRVRRTRDRRLRLSHLGMRRAPSTS
ncbi:MAG: ribosome-associated translation inhibitor RaiA [Xanthomonadales bacterium]|jgi:ribosomal subunit interface protein|nr:ribosome-associated translation inhibitor RaiA [Xanthomonadales bacterium]